MLIRETISVRARARIHVERAYGYDEKRGIWLYRPDEEEDVEAPNLVTNAGRDQLHLQGYATTGLASNGFNYIALSNDATAPAVTDTTLASELTTNGLNRQQGVYAHTAGTNTSTVAFTFTYTGGSSQGVQKTALFNAVSSGTMNHEIAFTQRTLFTSDTLTVTFTITLG